MYVSPDIQNALLNVMGNIIRKKIVSAVQDATYFSILADETKDLSKQEQMAIVIRYVDVQSCTVYERFLTYIKAESLDAASLSSFSFIRCCTPACLPLITDAPSYP